MESIHEQLNSLKYKARKIGSEIIIEVDFNTIAQISEPHELCK